MKMIMSHTYLLTCCYIQRGVWLGEALKATLQSVQHALHAAQEWLLVPVCEQQPSTP
jgi:hypothetical protein